MSDPVSARSPIGGQAHALQAGAALAAFEAAPHASLLISPDSPTFTIVGASDAFLRATMTGREALVGTPLFAAFPDGPGGSGASEARNLRDALQHALATRRPVRTGFHPPVGRDQDDSQSERRWSARNVPVLGEDGEVVSLIHSLEEAAGVREREPVPARFTPNEAGYRAIVESSTDYAMITLDLESRITSWNEGARRILGWTEPEILGRPSGVFFTEADVADGIPRVEMHSARTEGRGVDERWHRRKDGEHFWASGQMMPLKGETGALIGYVKILRDRTEQRRTQEALRQKTDMLTTVTDHLSEAVFQMNEAGRITFLNPAAEQMFGWAARELIGRNLHETLHHHHPDGRPYPAEECAFVHALVSGRTVHRREAVFFRKDDTRVDVVCSNAPVLVDGTVTGAVMTVSDVTAQKRAEERQRLLNHELGHRMKNTLAMVQAIAAQTLRNAPSLGEAKEALAARLIALGKAHDILLERNIESAEIREIVTSAIGLHDDGRSRRFRVAGPSLRIGSSAALSLALMLHELGTNAVKYGALSTPEGQVEVAWEILALEGALSFRLRWSEHGGPPVTPPTRRGFGSRLIGRGLAGELGGTVSLAYEPTGVVCTVTAPLAGFQEE